MNLAAKLSLALYGWAMLVWFALAVLIERAGR